jgi:hypothetical protein
MYSIALCIAIALAAAIFALTNTKIRTALKARRIGYELILVAAALGFLFGVGLGLHFTFKQSTETRELFRKELTTMNPAIYGEGLFVETGCCRDGHAVAIFRERNPQGFLIPHEIIVGENTIIQEDSSLHDHGYWVETAEFSRPDNAADHWAIGTVTDSHKKDTLIVPSGSVLRLK